jgi:hypothetical protein
MIPLDRRTFLSQAVAAPLVYGLTMAGDDPQAVIRAALARMKETRRWGVVLVPPVGNGRFQFSQALWALAAFDNEDEEAHLLMCQAIFTALPEEVVRVRFSVPPGTTRVLLSPEGKVLASDAEPLSIVSDPAKFTASFRAFIYGPSNVRLVENARAVESDLKPDLKSALANLGSSQDEDRINSLMVLAPKVEALAPVLGRLAEAGVTDLERRRARNLLTSYFASLKEDAPGTRVPYGCSGPIHWDPCQGCGMGRIPERSRKFLRFLGDPVPKRGE